MARWSQYGCSVVQRAGRTLGVVALLTAIGCESEEQNLAAQKPGTIAPPASCAKSADCPAFDNTCLVPACTKGQCVAQLAKDGTPCDDGNLCNGADACAGGTCKAGDKALECSDGDACTGDTCNPKAGCVFAPLPSKCDDDQPCTVDVCAKGKCTNTAIDSATCDDGNECTVGDKCAAGKCTPGANKGCDDDNVCTTDSCDPDLGCIGKNNEAPCSDNDACTKGDECKDGECRAGKTVVSCDDGKPCTDDSCTKLKGCVNANTADGKACSDGDACTDGDACKAGTCSAGTALACGDSDVCTDDACDKAKGCTHANNTAKCEDGDVCSEGDACAAGKCAPGKAKNCDDANTCTSESCDPKSGCQLAATASPCDDANACTTGDACKDKACAAGAGKPDCDDKNPCTDDACDAKVGCTHTNNTATCDDGDAKTAGDVCAAGKCAGSIASDPTPTCATYCEAVTSACGTSGANAQYASLAECTSWCADLAMIFPGAAADKSGNTIGCRAYHAKLAKVDASSAATHCPHAGKTGGNMCGTWCENYCSLAQMNCMATLGFKNQGECMSTCNKAPVNSAVNDQTGYSVQCMIVQGGLAFNDPTICQSMTVVDGGIGKCKAPPKPQTVKVGTKNFAFDPADVTLNAGDSVEFALEAFHNAVEVDEATWMANGDTAKANGFKVEFGGTPTKVAFAKAGVYYYVCTPHVASKKMKGKITVK
ncbi:MAG: hypothetical protein FJ100_18615 [Deltaproteobacteria bacterium]|nr:hypothetical protein [Deltaproteobacteria bacterium]